MGTVHYDTPWAKSKGGANYGDDNGSDGGDNGGMEARVAELESFAKDANVRLTRIETRLDATATKHDLADAKSSLVQWIVGTAIGISAAAITVFTFVLNNAAPKPAMAPQPNAIVIQMPQAPVTTTPAPPAK